MRGMTRAVLPLLCGCSAPVLCPSDRVLDAFWADLDRRYAVFEERLGDQSWDALGAEACDALPRSPSSDERFDALLDLARHLDDGHTTLSSGDREADAWVSVYPHYRALYALEGNAEDAYLDAPLRWGARDWMAWGTIGSVGYLSLTSMDGLSPGGGEARDVAVAAAVMEEVRRDLAHVDAMIVDVRANEGGWDAVSLELARHFAGPEAVAWSEARRDGPGHGDFGPWRDTLVAASGPDAFDVPVVLLTSGGTFSAAETFALAMRVRDRVTLLGEPTSGHFSDLIDGELPNGWTYTLSAERYRAADGVVYEARGVPVDFEVPLRPDALDEARDVMLDAALHVLGR